MEENGTNGNDSKSASARPNPNNQQNPMRLARKEANKSAWAMARLQADARVNVEQIEERIAELAATEAQAALDLMQTRREGASYNDLGLSAARLVGVSRLIREKSTSNPGRASLTDDQKRRELMDLMLENARGEAVEAEVVGELPAAEEAH